MASSKLAFAAAVACFAALASAAAATQFPYFHQCDPRWGSDMMGVPGAGPGEHATICKEGCAMSCVSMALNGLGVVLPSGDDVNPGSLNKWLAGNDGYVCAGGDCNNLRLAAPDNLTDTKGNVALRLVGEVPPPSADAIAVRLEAGTGIFVAHVRDQSHFVLLVERQGGTTFRVHDPFFNQTTYDLSTVHDIIFYDVWRAGEAETTPFTGVAGGDGGGSADEALRAVVAKGAWVPKSYPLYKQCNASWGNDIIETTTVCKVGCLMSSTSMALAGHTITIPAASGAHVLADPGSLNAFLRSHNGYNNDNDMFESVVPQVDPARVGWNASRGMHTSNDLSIDTIRSLLAAGEPVIANVMHGHHFVLVVGTAPAGSGDDDTLYINDPGFTRQTYSRSKDVVGWRLFTMSQA